MTRPNIEHDRSTTERFDRFLFIPGLYEPRVPVPGKHYTPSRLRVHWDPEASSLVEILDENTTSETRESESLDDGEHHALTLTTEQARWLHTALGDWITLESGAALAVDGRDARLRVLEQETAQLDDALRKVHELETKLQHYKECAQRIRCLTCGRLRSEPSGFCSAGHEDIEREHQARRDRNTQLLLNLLAAGDAVALLQPAVHAKTQEEAERFARLYAALNDARRALEIR